MNDLPDDGPPALYRSEPELPSAGGWDGPEAFPRTSGTGRLLGGALLWTDFLYDDHGATGTSTGNPAVQAGSPSFGTYTYPAGPASNNGADIFRAAVRLGSDATVWRVDWNTLADPDVPIAEWTFDRDDDASTGGSAWPAGAGVSSPGIDAALVVSSHGARLLTPTGLVLATAQTLVDRAARSFVVRIPRSVLDPAGTWRVRLAAGLANADGTAFAPATGALPGQPAVYNVTFRTVAQEPGLYNMWNDDGQTQALDAGDVSAFSTTVDWGALAAHRETPEARPRGWSARWYVSSVELGDGVLTGPDTITDGAPNFLGRVQPYSVYVPESYSPAKPVPLTFLLHSLTQNHNQYAATTPNFTRQACEDRGSICVTTLGRGPDGGYAGVAQLDFWEVWNRVASAYTVDPERTVLAGYSMGGIGTNEIAQAHPDLFARAIVLAGGVGDVPSLANLRWVPTYLAGGGADELVWYTTNKAEADRLDALGYRYRWVTYPAVEHAAFELSDMFADSVAYMTDARRTVDPGHVSYTWTPSDGQFAASSSQLTQGGVAWTQRPDLGVMTTGAYWLRDLAARSNHVGASVDAVSSARPDPRVTAVRSNDVTTAGPGPGAVQQLEWTLVGTPASGDRITMTLANVSAVSVLLDHAGFPPGTSGVLDVTTDGPTSVQLGGVTLTLEAGHHVVPFTA